MNSCTLCNRLITAFFELEITIKWYYLFSILKVWTMKGEKFSVLLGVIKTNKVSKNLNSQRVCSLTCMSFFQLTTFPLLPPTTKLGQSNIFIGICDSVQKGVGVRSGGGVVCLVWGVPGPGRGVSGLRGCAWSRGVPAPRGVWRPPRDGYCCGRYASYWNAFLFYLFLFHKSFALLFVVKFGDFTLNS